MTAEVIALRIIHIVGGIFWVGAFSFISFFLMPSLANSPAAASEVMAGMTKRKFIIVMPVLATLNILTGVRLLWIASAGFSAAYFSSPVGMTFSIGGGAAILAYVVGLIVTRPAQVRMGQIGAAMATEGDATRRSALATELGQLRKRAAVFGSLVMLLLVVAVVGMAIARYMS